MSELHVRTWMTSVPPTIGSKESLRRARALMRKTKVTELLVVDDERLIGTLSEHDIWEHCPTSALLLDDKQTEDLLEQMRVGGVMALHPHTIRPDSPLCEAAEIFASSGRPGIPVVEDGSLVGFLTETTVLRVFAALLRDDGDSPTEDPSCA